MAIAVLDALQESTTVPSSIMISAGVDRLLFFMVGTASGANATPSDGVTIGGVAGTLLALADDNANTWDVASEVYFWTDAQIQSMSGTAVSVSGSPTLPFYVWGSLSGASQLTPSASTFTPEASSGAHSFARAADSITGLFHTFDINQPFLSTADPSATQDAAWTSGQAAYAFEADTSRTVDYTWSHSGVRGSAIVLFNVQEAAAAGATISTADDVVLGTTTNYTRSGWTESAAGATFTVGTSVLTASSVTDSTITWPARVNGLNVAPFGAGTLEVTSATESASISVDFVAEAGYTDVTLAGTLNIGENGWLYNYAGTPVVGDQGYYPSTSLSLLANGDIGESSAGTYTCYVLDVSDAQIQLEEFDVIIGDNTTPDVPDLGLDVTDAEPSSYTVRSFVSSGIATAIDWPATGSAEVSLSPSSGYGASVNAGNGTTIYVRLQASATFDGVVSGGVAGDSFSITTRSQIKPELPPTLSVSGYVDQAYSRTLTIQSGDPASSWAITGGADSANYTLSNAGLLQRTTPNNVEESEIITVTATNGAGVSSVMTLTINFTIQTGEVRSFVKIRSRLKIAAEVGLPSRTIH